MPQAGVKTFTSRRPDPDSLIERLREADGTKLTPRGIPSRARASPYTDTGPRPRASHL